MKCILLAKEEEPMMYDSELQFLQKVLNKFRVQSQVINPADSGTRQFHLGPGNRFLAGEGDTAFFDLLSSAQPNTLYRARNVFWCRYIFLQLPFGGEKNILLIGPYLDVDISHGQLMEQVEKLNISPKFVKDLELYYSSLPVMKEENHIFAMVTVFAEGLWEGSHNFETVDVNIENTSLFLTDYLLPESHFGDSLFSMQSIERRYEHENNLIHAVSRGDIHRAELLLSDFSSLSFQKRVPDELRNMKNYGIIMNTLLRKAVEQGGVHPIHIDSVSSDFAKRIEGLLSVAQTTEFMREMLKTYCRLARENAIKNYSALVQKAIVYIDHDLAGDLSLRAMAAMNNVSPGYFSQLFKKEMGQTLTEYVNGKRIGFAKHLLKTSNLQIQTIAQHCGILDFHYFCRLFKRFTGKTPTAYKNDLPK